MEHISEITPVAGQAEVPSSSWEKGLRSPVMATWNIRFKESAHENHHCDIRLLLHFIGKVQQADKKLLVFERISQVAITGFLSLLLRGHK